MTLATIIRLLKENEAGYVSGEEISRQLNITRTGIWKHVQELRRRGYKVEATPNLGYRLTASPDKLFPWEISNGLNTEVIGREFLYFDTLSSTMDEIFRRGVEGAPEGVVVCAETQTRGRGRLGRSWTSPKGKGIYLSVLVRPKVSPMEATKLTLLSAVALCEAVRRSTGLNVAIKWPNDLLIEDRKLAGILTEMSAEVDRVNFVGIGIGLNVNTPAAHLPPQATSLKIEAGRSFSRADMVREILRSLDEWYLRWLKEGDRVVLTRWKELSATLGKSVRVLEGNFSCEGTAVGLAPDGGLLVRLSDGKMVKKMSGDVVQIEAVVP